MLLLRGSRERSATVQSRYRCMEQPDGNASDACLVRLKNLGSGRYLCKASNDKFTTSVDISDVNMVFSKENHSEGQAVSFRAGGSGYLCAPGASSLLGAGW